MRHAVIAAAFLLLAVSCSRPASMESFVKSDGRDAYGRYPFELQMDDSSSVYDISVMADMVCDKETFSSFEGFPLRVTYLAPSGERYAETVWLGSSALSGHSYFGRTLYAPYRSGLVPTEYGTWRLLVGVPDSLVARYRLSGIGIRIDRKKKN